MLTLRVKYNPSMAKKSNILDNLYSADPQSLPSGRMIVLIGLMGAGKTSIGKRLAIALALPFFDTDEEVERAAGRSVEDIFADYGEAAFRDGERKVIERLLDGPAGVLATGGGAFMNAQTRALIHKKGLSIWLHAGIDVLMERVSRRNTRPLLRQPNPKNVMQTLMDERYPVYAEADIRVESGLSSHERVVEQIIIAINDKDHNQ